MRVRNTCERREIAFLIANHSVNAGGPAHVHHAHKVEHDIVVALFPGRHPLHQRLRRLRFLHRRTDGFRVERTQFPGGTFTGSRPAPFHGARASA